MNKILEKLEAKKNLTTPWRIKLVSNEDKLAKNDGVFIGYSYLNEKLIILSDEGNQITDVSIQKSESNGQVIYIVNGEIAVVEKVSEDKFYDRHRGIELTKDIGSRNILICGVGSVGSRCAVHLSPTGVRIGLVDYDELGIHNFVRWGIPLDWKKHIGRKKVHVLAEYLQMSYPQRVVVPYDIDVVGNQTKFLDILSREKPDLILCSTDTELSQRVVNAAAWFHKIPVLYIGLSDGAKSAQFILSSPNDTPCFQCFLGAEISHMVTDQGRVYGTASGVPALGIDISFCAAMAAKIALYIIRFGVKETQKEFFNGGNDEKSLGNVLWFSNEKAWIFDEPFEKLIAAVEHNLECVCCGTK